MSESRATLGDRVLAARESGVTMRCHTIPHHGEYSVGLHCYNVVSMLFIFHPEPNIRLIQAALWHDAGERWIGDIPAPAKWNDPQLAIAALSLEVAARFKWGLEVETLTLNENEWLHIMDSLEFYLWCQDQLGMGNQHVSKAYELVYKHLLESCPMTGEFEDVHKFIRSHRFHRLEEGL